LIKINTFCIKKYAGILPSKSSHSNIEMFTLFSKAFCGLYYSPSVFWASVFSRLTYLYAAFNLSENSLLNRGIFSAYRDVMQLYDIFGPIITITRTDASIDDDSFYDYMRMDIFVLPQSDSIPTLLDSTEPNQFFHYDPLKLDTGEHLSSNIPNFVVLMGFAVICNELNDFYMDKYQEALFVPEQGKYLLKSNASYKVNLFNKNNKGLSNKPPSLRGSDGKDNKDYETEFRSMRKKNWLKDPVDKCLIFDLQLKVQYVEGYGKTSDIEKWYTLAELAKSIFYDSNDQVNKFYQMDESFGKIIRFLQNPMNLKDFIRIPFSSLQNYVHRSERNEDIAEGIPKDVKTLFSKIFGLYAFEHVGTNDDELEDTTSTSRISRPMAIKFGSTERKLFKAAQTVRAKNTEVNVSSQSETICRTTVMSMYDQATIHAEKFLESIAIALAGEKTGLEIKPKYLELTHLYGKSVVFGNSASLLVQQVKKILTSDTIHEALVSDEAMTPENMLVEDDELIVENSQNEGQSKKDIDKQSKSKSTANQKTKFDGFLKVAFNDESMVTKKFQEMMNFDNDGEENYEEPWSIIETANIINETNEKKRLSNIPPENNFLQQCSQNNEKSDINEKTSEQLEIQLDESKAIKVVNELTSKIPRRSKKSKQVSIEYPKKSNRELIDDDICIIDTFMDKATKEELMYTRLNIDLRLDYIVTNKVLEAKFTNETNMLIEAMDNYNDFTEGGNFCLEVLTFGKKTRSNLDTRRSILKMFNRPEYPNDPLIELEENGKQLGEFEYIFIVDAETDEQRDDFSDINKKCQNMVHEHNKFQDEYVWECSRIQTDYQYKSLWFHVKSTEKEVRMATPEHRELSGMNHNFTESCESSENEDVKKVAV
jgi:hypothetical protein